MIDPEEIRRKAENLYPKFVAAWLNGEEYFPRSIPARRDLDGDQAQAIASVHRLRGGAKETLSYGYTVEWKEVNSQKYGKNLFPDRILFDTEQDFLRYLGKQQEFETLTQAIEKIREKYPQLDSWIRTHRNVIVEAASNVDGLLLVVDYLCAHPRPGVFARELPLPIDSKFVERHHRILRSWLDILLPPDAIRADEQHFERRYGLRYAEPHLLVRFLDPTVQEMYGCPWSECSIPIHDFDRFFGRESSVGPQKEPRYPVNVLIVENKVNLLTLPSIRGTLAMGGLGNAVTDLRLIEWLREVKMWYWGDIDMEGFVILSRLRVHFPDTKSWMMDIRTLEQWRGTAGQTKSKSGGALDRPPGLTETEFAAYEICATNNLRIEQESIPQSYVLDVLDSTAGLESGQPD